MVVKSHLSKIFIFAAVFFALIILGCAEEDTSPTGNNINNPQAADSLVELANNSLGLTLNLLINSDPEKPDDIDFSVTYGLYSQALAQDASNLYANFGVGLCGLLMITQDAQIQAAWDEWYAFLDTTELFSPPGSSGLENSSLFPELGLPNSTSDLNIPLNAIIASIYGVTNGLQSDVPTIAGVQSLFENELIPRLNDAISKLTVVAQDTTFIFEVTPQMQGDPYEDPLELDYTEICAGLAELYSIRALADIFIAYNLSFESYDSLGMLEAFAQSSNFLGLKSSGSQKLADASYCLDKAIDYVESGVNFLKLEFHLLFLIPLKRHLPHLQHVLMRQDLTRCLQLLHSILFTSC